MHKTMKLALLIMSLGMLSLALYSCDVSDPMEDVHLYFNMVPMSTVVSVNFVDAVGYELITDKDVKLEIGTLNSDKIVNLENEAVTEFQSINTGMICFAIKDGLEISPQNPLELNIIATASGYLQNSRALTLTSMKGQSYTMVLANSTNLPGGVTTTTTKSGTAINGITSEEIVIETSPAKPGDARVSVRIPAGTTIFDGSGNKIDGKLTTSAFHFDPGYPEALEVFPGGFVVNASNTKNATTERGTFVTAGFSYFSTKNDKGEVAVTFDKSVLVTMYIPGGTINPETGLPIANGDVVPIWSYDPDTGIWDKEGTGTADGPDGDGTYKVELTTKHFSWWNLDWHYGNACYEGTAINLTGDFNSVTLSINRKDNGQLMYSGIYVSNDDPVLNLINAPGGIPVVITAYSSDGCYTNGSVVGSIDVDDLCGDDVELPIVIPSGAGPSGDTTVSFTVSAWCANEPDVRLRPSLMIYMMGDCSWFFAGYMENGELAIPNLTLGEEYIFGVWFDGHIYDFPYTVNQESYTYEFELPASLCAMF